MTPVRDAPRRREIVSLSPSVTVWLRSPGAGRRRPGLNGGNVGL